MAFYASVADHWCRAARQKARKGTAFILITQIFRRKNHFCHKICLFVHKKRRIVSRQPNLYLTLKSNTMKNTMQKYCFLIM